MARVFPITGSDSARIAAYAAGLITERELHGLLTQKRLFLANQPVGPQWLGTVANQTAMLALATSHVCSCFPMDKCWRTDTASVWTCIANRGTDLADWIDLGNIAPQIHGNEAHDPAFATASDLNTLDSAVADHIADPDAHKGQKNSIEVDAGDLQLVGDEASPGNSKVYGTNASGVKGWYSAASGGGAADPHAWTTEEVIEVSTSQTVAAEFPSSGVFDTAKEYRIEFTRWRNATNNQGRSLRVDQGSGFISSNSYERSLFWHASSGTSGTTSNSTAQSNALIVPSLGNEIQEWHGYIQFIPGLQASMKVPIEVGCRAYATVGTGVWRCVGVVALSTPINDAIDRIQLLCLGGNTDLGTFILKSRPLVPDL